MSPSIYDPKMTLDHSGFLAAMEKAREAANQSIGMMSAISGLGAKMAGLSAPGIKAFTGRMNDAMKQARQVFPGVGIPGKDMGTRKPASIDPFQTPDTDRYAKLGLFIGSAPQTPGLSEARRTATATEAVKKGIDKLNVVLAGNNTRGGLAVFS